MLVQDRLLMTHCNANKDGRNTVLYVEKRFVVPGDRASLEIYSAVLHMNCPVNCRLPSSTARVSKHLNYSKQSAELAGPRAGEGARGGAHRADAEPGRGGVGEMRVRRELESQGPGKGPGWMRRPRLVPRGALAPSSASP